MKFLDSQLSAHQRLTLRRKELEGFFAKKKLGQNFLISDRVIQAIIQETKALKPASVIEIGPGLGALTDPLLELQIPLFLVEIDTDLAQFWRDKGLTMIEQDALKLDWDSFSSTLVRPSILVSNLPYQISSRLVVDRSLDARPLDAMILMFQKEVALKILAQAPSAETGFLSVLAQSFWQVRSLVKAKAGDFLPPPKVASQVLVFKPISPPLIKDKKMYLEFLKASFSAPRKLLSSNLKQLFSAQVVTQAFDQLQFKENIRAHELFIPDWVRLFEFLKSRLDHC